MASPLLKSRWLVGHLLVVLFSLTFVGLGLWQLDRHDQQRVANALLEEKLATAPTDLDTFRGSTADLLSTRVIVAGTYDYSRQLERRPRSLNGRVGFDAVTPLVTSSDTILVNRGFIPDENQPTGVPTYSGRLTVTGWLRPSQGTSSLGPQNPDDGVLSTIARIDIARLAPQFEEGLFGFYIDLVGELPAAGGIPTLVPKPPSLTNRPNFLYAIQWFAFTAIASIGWVLYLRKQFFVMREK